jgi:hypothetical protein
VSNAGGEAACGEDLPAHKGCVARDAYCVSRSGCVVIE